MAWPQIVVIILFTITATISLAQHGQPKGNWNFLATLFDIIIMCWLLGAGGFWK